MRSSSAAVKPAAVDPDQAVSPDSATGAQSSGSDSQTNFEPNLSADLVDDDSDFSDTEDVEDAGADLRIPCSYDLTFEHGEKMVRFWVGKKAVQKKSLLAFHNFSNQKSFSHQINFLFQTKDSF